MNLTITVHKNRIHLNMDEDFKSSVEYFSKHGVNIKFTFRDIDVHGYKSVYYPSLYRWLLSGTQGLFPLDTKADLNMFVFDQGEWSSPKGSQFPLRVDTPTGMCAGTFITVGTYHSTQKNGLVSLEIKHEIMHALCHLSRMAGIPVQDVMDTYFKNSVAEFEEPDSNFSQQWKLLQPFIQSKTMKKYKYFTEKEIKGLKHELILKLDEARDYAGIPFVINSGLRTDASNDLAGGVNNSAHKTGEAVDIKCVDSAARWKMVNAFLKAGFTRIGIGKDFVHADISTTLPTPRIWHYY